MAHPSFAAILARLAPAAARRLFAKAEVASALRHLALAAGDARSARLSSAVKIDSLRRAVALCPRRLKVRHSERPGLLSIRLKGRSLHVPASAWE